MVSGVFQILGHQKRDTIPVLEHKWFLECSRYWDTRKEIPYLFWNTNSFWSVPGTGTPEKRSHTCSGTQMVSAVFQILGHQKRDPTPVFKYLLNATLNCAFSCTRIVRVNDKLSLIFMKHERLETGL
jgi:hypothetical protein